MGHAKKKDGKRSDALEISPAHRRQTVVSLRFRVWGSTGREGCPDYMLMPEGKRMGGAFVKTGVLLPA